MVGPVVGAVALMVLAVVVMLAMVRTLVMAWRVIGTMLGYGGSGAADG